jgi:hypothetical protein
MNRSDQINELAAALAKAQGAIPNATMNKINPHFKSKYADLASVLDAIRVPLSTHGLATMQTMECRDDSLFLVTMLAHSSGQWLSSEYPLPATARPQEMGSALTYARRYSLAALICNSADEDDDAENAERANQKIIAPNIMQQGKAKEPYHPETGEILSSPGPIAIPQTAEGANDWIEFGQTLIAACKNGSTPQWIEANAKPLAAMLEQAPKVHKRVMANLKPE